MLEQVELRLSEQESILGTYLPVSLIGEPESNGKGSVLDELHSQN